MEPPEVQKITSLYCKAGFTTRKKTPLMSYDITIRRYIYCTALCDSHETLTSQENVTMHPRAGISTQSLLLPCGSGWEGLWCRHLALPHRLCCPAEAPQTVSVRPGAAADPQTSVSNWSPDKTEHQQSQNKHQSCRLASLFLGCTVGQSIVSLFVDDAYQSKALWYAFDDRSRGEVNVVFHSLQGWIFCRVQLQRLFQENIFVKGNCSSWVYCALLPKWVRNFITSQKIGLFNT